MKIEKIDAGTFQVNEATIRGYDWQLIREPGQGTYARIAGPDDDAPDEDYVIEEWSDPERRALWDGLSVMAAAAAARRQILEDIGEGFAETAADIAELVHKTAGWVRKIAPELEGVGLARKAGTSWLFSPQAAEYIKNRPDGRGRKPTVWAIQSGADHQYITASTAGKGLEGGNLHFTLDKRIAAKWNSQIEVEAALGPLSVRFDGLQLKAVQIL